VVPAGFYSSRVIQSYEGKHMSKEVTVIPNSTLVLFRFRVSSDFELNNDAACNALLANGTPFNMSVEEFCVACESHDCSDVFMHDKQTGETRDYQFS